MSDTSPDPGGVRQVRWAGPSPQPALCCSLLPARLAPDTLRDPRVQRTCSALVSRSRQHQKHLCNSSLARHVSVSAHSTPASRGRLPGALRALPTPQHSRAGRRDEASSRVGYLLRMARVRVQVAEGGSPHSAGSQRVPR